MKEASLIKKFKEGGMFYPISNSFKNVIQWFILLGISYVIQLLGWIEMPKAYALIDISLRIIVIFIYLFTKKLVKKRVFYYAMLLSYLGMFVLSGWIVSYILDLNFFAIYIVMRLGLCFTTKMNK